MEESTLLIRHLPKELSSDERKDFLHHIGATQVRLNGTSGPMRHTAFAVFPNKEIALKILEQLHQAQLLGSSLVVELARGRHGGVPSLVDNEGVSTSDKLKRGDGEESVEASQQLKAQKEVKFDTTFATWGVKHPRRPELRYLYPPPSPSILTNIMHTLAAQPRFYTQVLHLMNKMDLPAPFGMVTSMPPMTRGGPMNSGPHRDTTSAPMTSMTPDPDDLDHREMDISSTEESEMGDSGGEARPSASQEAKRQVCQATRRRKHKQRPHKRPRLADLQDGPAPLPSATPLPVSQVFEQEGTTQPRRIRLNIGGESIHQTNTLPPREALYDPAEPTLPPPLPHSTLPLPHSTLPLPPPSSNWNHPAPSGDPYAASGMLGGGSQQQPRDVDRGQHHSAPATKDQEAAAGGSTRSAGGSTRSAGGFGILQPQVKGDDHEDESQPAQHSWRGTTFISKSELRKSRLSTDAMRNTSVFKRYNSGEPSCRLYIKNLAKQVSEEDLHWVFGRYVDWEDETETNIFDIRLMKEGRMKGQAFVTLPTEESAKSAVRDTNAFVLKEKPMVVQFARSAKAEEDKASQI